MFYAMNYLSIRSAVGERFLSALLRQSLTRVFSFSPSTGAGRKLKVGGGQRPTLSAIKNFGRAPPLFGYTSTISRFGERFHDACAVWLVSCSSLMVPPVLSHV